MTGSTSLDPLDWYAEVGRILSKHIRDWKNLPHDTKAGWVADVVATFEDGTGDVIVPAELSKTGKEVTVPLPRQVPLPLAVLVAA